jgi:PEP-CTERM motif
MSMRTRPLLASIAASVLAMGTLTASPAAADPVTWSFTGTQGGTMGEGTYGNTRTFTAGGVTVTASAWGYTYGSSDSAFENAALGRWSTGLGACNRSEGSNCGSPNHQVDNVGVDDWILFTFSAAVDITSVRIDPWGTYDRDVSYYVGNVTTPLNLTGVTYAGLTARGFGTRWDNTADASDAARNVQPIYGLNGSEYVNAILVGGQMYSDQDDWFKITSISGNTRTTNTVPEPTTLVLFGLGAAMAVRRRTARA